PASAPAAAVALPCRDPSAASSGDRAPRAELPKHLRRWADRGFSVVSSADAEQLNAWLRHGAEDGRGDARGAKGLDKKYIVQVVRDKATKGIGTLSLASSLTERDVKDAAVALAVKEGQLKSREESKGVQIARNVVSVRA
ncbi:unnamed protein product, partial [Prorocentrum cordatum]